MLHFVAQSSLLLASQEAVFNRPKYFFHIKNCASIKKVPAESNRYFVLVITVEWGKE